MISSQSSMGRVGRVGSLVGICGVLRGDRASSKIRPNRLGGYIWVIFGLSGQILIRYSDHGKKVTMTVIGRW